VTKERLKTILLLSLVSISLLLTRQIWIRSPYRTDLVFEDGKSDTSDYLQIDIVKPHKYLLNFNEDSHTIFYSDTNNNLWTSIHSSLVDILSSNNVKTDEISNEEFIAYHDNRSIVFYFPEEYNTYILARFLDIPQPNDITEKIEKVDSIYVYLGQGEPFFVFSHKDFHLKIHEIDLDLEYVKTKVGQIEKSNNITYYYPMRDSLNVDNDIYIPYKMSKAIPAIYVKNEINTDNIEDIREIAEVFFQKDIDYIREIVENNGSVLYLYGDKVLKVSQNGFLEYYSPLEEQVSERNLYISLVTASEFLSSNMEIPEDLYLDDIEEIEFGENLGYRFTFKYRIGGLPVILKDEEIEDFIQLEVFNKYIRSYKRFIREEMDTKSNNLLEKTEMLSAYEVISMNYNLIKNDYIVENNIQMIDEEKLKEDILLSIEDISIAYLDPCENKVRERLIGVWILKMRDNVYAFDVYDGSLVIKK